jgi:nitrile hydratase beta subunit
MNGVHDLGGTDGMGPVVPDTDGEPVFAADWERAALLMFPASARAGLFQLDQFRYGIEQMPPVEYLTSPYYDHWAYTVTHYAKLKGLFDDAELEERTRYFLENPAAPMPDRKDPELIEFLDTVLVTGASCRLESDKVPQFAVGDRVVVAADSPVGHTRRARYVRGKSGVIALAHGAFVYPDTIANGGEQTAEHVYTVRFTAEELWGQGIGDPKGTVCYDVWEPYITHAHASTGKGA